MSQKSKENPTISPQKDAKLSNPNQLKIGENPGPFSKISKPSQFLQVIEKKQYLFGNEDDLKQIYDQVLKKSKTVHSKHTNKEPPKKQQPLKPAKSDDQIKRDQILKNIEEHIRTYKLHTPAPHLNSFQQKQRRQLKQKTFKYLLYGIQELKLLKHEQLSDEENRIVRLTKKDTYHFAQLLTNQIDEELFQQFGFGVQGKLRKKYEGFIKNFLDNFADDNNLELRRKVLTRVLSAKAMPTMDEMQFYPDQKRKKIIQKQDNILREAAAKQKPVHAPINGDFVYPPPPQNINFQQKKDSNQISQEQNPQKKYKHLQADTYITLKNLMKDDQILKMRNLLENNFRTHVRDQLVKNLDAVFQFRREI